ncbi:MAG: dicarboxylate/amino acid:cation symporter [Gemmatimonadales bacterium]
MKQSLTAQCLVGLVLGVAVGIVLPRWYPEAVGWWLGVTDVTIRGWTNALRLIVTPLIVAHLFLAISASALGKTQATKLGWVIPAVFVGLLAFAAVCAVAATGGLLALPLISRLPLSDVLPGDGIPGPLPPAGAADSPAWLDDLVPPNLIAAAGRPEAILGLMLFTLAFALAARRLGAASSKALETGSQAVRDALFILIGWLLRLAPILLLALGFRFAVRSGLRVGQFLLAHIGMEVTVLLVCIAALYPLAVLIGRVSLGRFAGALFPAQVTAAATRSSLATVPVLIRDSETRLGIPQAVSALVIPLGGAMLKLSPMVNYPVKLLFLAYVLGIPLGPSQIVAFAVTILLLSPATSGTPSVIPSGRQIPAFVVAGIPPEYVILLGTTRAIADVFLTVLNTTGYLTAAVLVSRLGLGWVGKAPAALGAAAAAPVPTSMRDSA